VERPILQDRPHDQHQTHEHGGDQSPQGAQSQGHTQEERETEGVSRMPDDGIGTGVDDMVTSVGLDADGRLEKLVDACPSGRRTRRATEHHGMRDDRPSSSAATTGSASQEAT
jgi:hypothetical protein